MSKTFRCIKTNTRPGNLYEYIKHHGRHVLVLNHERSHYIICDVIFEEFSEIGIPGTYSLDNQDFLKWIKSLI